MFSLCALSLLCFGLSGACSPGPVPPPAAPAPELDALFQRTNGWIGADGDYSIPLNDRTTLWLFGDTVIGQVRDGKRVNATMVNNSIALQSVGGSPRFFYRTNSAGKPASVFQPVDSTNSFFWPWDGIRTERGLFVFLMQVRHTAEKSVWGFRRFRDRPRVRAKPGCAAARLENHACELSLSSHSDGRCCATTVSFTFMARTENVAAALLARAPEEALDDFGQWRFYENGQWGKATRTGHADFFRGARRRDGAVAAGIAPFRGCLFAGYFRGHRHADGRNPGGALDDRRVIYHCLDGQRLAIILLLRREKCTRN